MIIIATGFDAAFAPVLSPDGVALETPISYFSWSVPFHGIEYCDVEQSRRLLMLNDHTSRGSKRTLYRTRLLYERLMTD